MVFRHSSTLKSHERIHIGWKPYKCKHCNKTFAVVGNLKVHERIHTGLKPYKCIQCSKVFNTAVLSSATNVFIQV
jgi:uncharacterized Zn-finger protein